MFFHVMSKWYPRFIYPLYTITKRSIAYTQNYIAKYKKYFSILKKNFHLQWTKSLAALGIFIAKWVSNDNSTAAEILFDWNIQKYSLLAKIKSFSFSWNIFSWSWFWRFWWCWQSSAEQSLETVNHMC